MLGKASKIGSGLFSKLKSGINDLTDQTLDYAAQKGWDQTLRSNVGINLPRSGPKHSQEYIKILKRGVGVDTLDNLPNNPLLSWIEGTNNIMKEPFSVYPSPIVKIYSKYR